MFLHVITPQGSYTSLDLDALPVWRLELGVAAVPSCDATRPVEPASLIALCLSYIAGGAKARAIIAAVDTKSPSDVIALVDTGLPYAQLARDRERLIESAKALYNVDAVRKEADEIIKKIAKLADIYHAFLDALGDVKASDGTFARSVGPKVKGVLEGWQFALTADRFDNWRKSPNTLWAREDERFDAPPAPKTDVEVPELGGQPPAEDVPHPQSRASKEKLRAARAKQATEKPAPEVKNDSEEPEVLALPEDK